MKVVPEFVCCFEMLRRVTPPWIWLWIDNTNIIFLWLHSVKCPASFRSRVPHFSKAFRFAEPHNTENNRRNMRPHRDSCHHIDCRKSTLILAAPTRTGRWHKNISLMAGKSRMNNSQLKIGQRACLKEHVTFSFHTEGVFSSRSSRSGS